MSHMMTYSGSLMLVTVAVAAYAMCVGWQKPRWVLPLGLLLAAALFLSETRSALGGAVAGVAGFLLLKKRLKLILGLAALLVLLFLLSPASIRQRLSAALNPEDANTKNRIELIGTGLRLIRAHPWFGVGTHVDTEALKYRVTQEFPVWMYIHLHNNFLQIAAERGVPGLILWLWFMAQICLPAFRMRYAAASGIGVPPDDRPDLAFIAIAALGGWIALLVAGMFEYNFGDSEVLTLFLFMISAPYAVTSSCRETPITLSPGRPGGGESQ
jgi:O-antigen ligase